MSSTGRLYISRHVVFNEDEFPFRHGFLNTKQPKQIVPNLSNLPCLPLADINSKLEQCSSGHISNNSQSESSYNSDNYSYSTDREMRSQ